MKVTFATNKEVTDYLAGIIRPHATALQGIIDKLPEGLRADFVRLKKDMDDTLAKLPPTDQVPAALDVSYALQSFCNTFERMQNYMNELTTRMTTIAKEASDKAAAYQGQLDKITNGELITKAAATELCTAARAQERDAMKPTIVGMRKQQIELAGLPLPTDELLGLPEAEYTPRFDAAKANVAALSERGFKLKGKGDGLVKELAWHTAEAFQGKLTAFGDVLGAPARSGEPLLGAPPGNTPPAAAEQKTRARMW